MFRSREGRVGGCDVVVLTIVIVVMVAVIDVAMAVFVARVAVMGRV